MEGGDTNVSGYNSGHEAEKEEDTVIESNDDEDDDGKGQVPSVSQGMRSMGLDGPVLPWDMQSSVQGGPSTGRSTYSSNNPALLQRPSPLDKYQDQYQTNNLIYNDPFGSTAYPQQSAYVRPPDQQASPLDTRFAFGRSEGQQRAYSSRNQEPSRLPVQQSAYGPQLAESSVPTNALGDYDPTFFTKSEYSDAQAQGGAWNDKLLPIRDPSKEISSHSGSGRSASPAQAEKQRRAEVEKSRKNKTEESQEKKSGSSGRKKTDDGQEKKSGDSRRKKALKSKDDAKDSRRHNRGGTK